MRRALAAIALLALLVAPARADDLGDAIDRALVKDKAGRPAEGLELLAPLAVQYDADPRLHYHRFLLLRALARNGEATDALERAATTAERWQATPETAPAFYALKAKIDAETREGLRYRRPARDAVKSYGLAGAASAKTLLAAGKPALALYFAEEMAFVVDDRDGLDAIAAVREGAGAAARETFAAGRLHRGEVAGAGDPKIAEKNVAEAARALQARRFDDARIAALAALEARPGDPAALASLAEASDGLGRAEEAVEAALRTLDARGDAKTPAAPNHARALRLLRAKEPSAADFAEQRASTAKAILALAQRARTARREYDAIWLEAFAAEVAPADPAVQKAVAARPPPSGTGATPKPASGGATAGGFADLLRDPSIWRFQNKGPGAGVAKGEILLTDNRTVFIGDAAPEGVRLGQRFTLRFEMRIEVDATAPTLAGEPGFWLTFAGSGETHALVLFPHGPHHVGFARQTPERWMIGETETLPADVPSIGAWHKYELAWTGAARRLVLSIDGKPVFDYVLEEGVRLDGPFSFGDGGLASLRFRGVALKSEP